MSYSSDSDMSEEKRQIVQATDLSYPCIETVKPAPEISAGRAKLESWLYRTLRIQLTDGRILIGNFLCTDSEANVILGMCMEDTEKGGEERILGLVMVPGRHIVKMEMEGEPKANVV